MNVGEILLYCMGFSMLAIIWIVVFFVLDEMILNGFFKKKLQRMLGAE